MIKKLLHIFNNKNKGFSILELLVSVAIFSVILLIVISFFFSINASNSKTKADREAVENARVVLERITYEIMSAKSIYTSTTTSNQLSLETNKYLPQDENYTFIDFFVCGSAICLKKESQNLIALTSDSVQVANLTFSQILNGVRPSIKINLTINYINPSNDANSNSSVTLISTVSLRKY